MTRQVKINIIKALQEFIENRPEYHKEIYGNCIGIYDLEELLSQSMLGKTSSVKSGYSKAVKKAIYKNNLTEADYSILSEALNTLLNKKCLIQTKSGNGFIVTKKILEFKGV